MATNPYVNKVQKADGTVLIDLTSDTATASDVAQGKYFHLPTGERVAGTGGGGGTTITIIPEQTISASSNYTQLTYTNPIVDGETYTVTINGTTSTLTAGAYNNSIYISLGSNLYIEYTNNNAMYFDVYDSSKYGTYTVKVEKQSGGGGGSTLITKAITANGTYDAEDDDADGYSSVTVNVSGTSMNFQVSNTQVRLGNKTSLTDTGLTVTVSKTGTYNVYWSAFRSNTSSGYTWGSQLYIGNTAYGSVNTTWSNSYNQINKLTGVSLTKDQVLHVYGQTRSGNSYYICCSNLILEQTA